MALYAFDGARSGDGRPPTHVRRLFEAAGGEAAGHYLTAPQPGIRDWLTSGLFLGGRQALRRARRAVAGDDGAVDVVGSGQGAALALLFASKIAPPAAVRFVGLFDTVVPRGVTGLRRATPPREPPAAVVVAHAIALDERRWSFAVHRLGVVDGRVRRLQGVAETWFRGVHDDVVRGTALGDVAFCWMARRAGAAGVDLDFEKLEGDKPRPDVDGAIGVTLTLVGRHPRRIVAGDAVHEAAREWSGRVHRSHREGAPHLFVFPARTPGQARPVAWTEVEIDATPADCG